MISRVSEEGLKRISKSRFWFNWKEEIAYEVYKLTPENHKDVLGLVSLDIIPEESRIEIRLLAVSRENRGKNKIYERIAGNLIAFACKQAIMLFAEMACVSLIPKTELIEYYQRKYFMIQAGKSLFVDGLELNKLLREYDHD